MIVVALGLLGACAAGSAEEPGEEQGEEIGVAEEALMIGRGGLSAKSCPGGGAPACVSCNSKAQCVTACSGGYSCDTESEGTPSTGTVNTCSTELDCRTYVAAPGGFVSIQ
jgi:hypothetical protein